MQCVPAQLVPWSMELAGVGAEAQVVAGPSGEGGGHQEFQAAPPEKD